MRYLSPHRACWSRTWWTAVALGHEMTVPATPAAALDTPPPPALPVPAARLRQKTVTGLTALIAASKPDQWTLRTPCPDWDVRNLVAHHPRSPVGCAAAHRAHHPPEVGSSLETPLDPGSGRCVDSGAAGRAPCGSRNEHRGDRGACEGRRYPRAGVPTPAHRR